MFMTVATKKIYIQEIKFVKRTLLSLTRFEAFQPEGSEKDDMIFEDLFTVLNLP